METNAGQNHPYWVVYHFAELFIAGYATRDEAEAHAARLNQKVLTAPEQPPMTSSFPDHRAQGNTLQREDYRPARRWRKRLRCRRGGRASTGGVTTWRCLRGPNDCSVW